MQAVGQCSLGERDRRHDGVGGGRRWRLRVAVSDERRQDGGGQESMAKGDFHGERLNMVGPFAKMNFS
jgi:hypothetical protein